MHRFRRPAAISACCLLIVGVLGLMAIPSTADQTPPDPVAQLLAPVLALLSPPQAQQAPAPPAPPPPPPTDAPASTTVADAVGPVTVFDSPDGSVMAHVDAVNSQGQPEAFAVIGQQAGWYQVELPIKPDGSTGWVRSSNVTTRSDPYYIRVHQGQFTLDLYKDGNLEHEFKVAVGAPATPTPTGNYFVWASQAWNQYPYAVGIFALSAFSPVLVNWPGGGRTGIHGWQDTSVLGKRASNGCVRMAGSDFQILLNEVPLGTPVELLA